MEAYGALDWGSGAIDEHGEGEEGGKELQVTDHFRV